MAGDKADRRTWAVLSKFARVKGAVMRPKAMFLSYCAESTLIQLTWTVPLISW